MISVCVWMKHVFGSSPSFYNTKSVVLCLGITSLVCLSVTIFSFQSKVRRTAELITSPAFKHNTGSCCYTEINPPCGCLCCLPAADWCHILSRSPVLFVYGHASLRHHHLHRRPFRIRKFLLSIWPFQKKSKTGVFINRAKWQLQVNASGAAGCICVWTWSD